MARPATTPAALRTRWALRALATAAPRCADAPGRAAARRAKLMGLRLPSALGLAAGFDRCGQLADRAGLLGLGAVELGSLCAGSRELARAICALHRARRGTGPGARRDARRGARAPREAHGVSLVKRGSTPWPEAAAEWAGALARLAGLADYVTVNPGRDRPPPAVFAECFGRLAAERDRLVRHGGPRLRLVGKLPSGWLSADGVGLARALVAHGADGLLLSAEGSPAAAHRALLRRVSQALGPAVGLISVGGVASPRELVQRLRAGADLVQVHTAARRTNRRAWLLRASRRRPLVAT